MVDPFQSDRFRGHHPEFNIAKDIRDLGKLARQTIFGKDDPKRIERLLSPTDLDAVVNSVQEDLIAQIFQDDQDFSIQISGADPEKILAKQLSPFIDTSSRVPDLGHSDSDEVKRYPHREIVYLAIKKLLNDGLITKKYQHAQVHIIGARHIQPPIVSQPITTYRLSKKGLQTREKIKEVRA